MASASGVRFYRTTRTRSSPLRTRAALIQRIARPRPCVAALISSPLLHENKSADVDAVGPTALAH